MVAPGEQSATRRKTKAKVAPPETQAPSETATPEGRSIFLFADGTGNSSAKLFKTNVWRMYEAIDFGAACKGRHVQVGYYDNGVGTSSFRPLALLGGIFGIGLKSNVLRLYTFLCRNYRPGDRIYVFGFSRGAFTIRLLVALVADQGILVPAQAAQSRSYQVHEASLSRQVRDAYRSFRQNFEPNLPPGRVLVAAGRGIRDGVIGVGRWVWHSLLRRPKPQPPDRHYADIEFVGVWDTVAAYGGPFAEFTRGIDDWVFPLTMPDYHLSPRVKKARHALSLDDERDAFWPLLWDEVYEQQLTTTGGPMTIGRDARDKPLVEENRKVAKDRLKQVWFAGVHSDVGGGYPDESLSYIPLLWMMDELGNEVEFLRPFVERARDLANPYGPIHDSRSGPAAYYRYQPRKIAAFMDQPRPERERTVSLRQADPNGKPAWRGLLKSVCVHESVFARIISGIDNYAPAALPATFDIVGSTGPRGIPSLTAANRETLETAASASSLRFEQQENAWDWVWGRRLIYFATIAMTVLLVLAPWTRWLQSLEQLCSDDRCFARSFVDIALFAVPQSIRSTLDPWAGVPLIVIVLGTLILVLISWGRRTERRFRDRVRSIWRDYLHESGKALTKPKKRWRIRPIRESLPYQAVIFIVKWQLLPALCGLASLVAVLYAAIIASTQVLYAYAEPRDWSCKASSGPTDLTFRTADSCKDLGIELKQGTPYRLTIKAIPEHPTDTIPWLDDSLPADPRHGVTDRHAIMILAAPLKRVTSANWLQVITEVRAPNDDPMTRWAFPRNIDMRRHDFTFLGKQTYETILCPRWNGRLFILVNDAAPLLSKRFYENNHGSAEVSVAPALDKKCT